MTLLDPPTLPPAPLLILRPGPSSLLELRPSAIAASAEDIKTYLAVQVQQAEQWLLRSQDALAQGASRLAELEVLSNEAQQFMWGGTEMDKVRRAECYKTHKFGGNSCANCKRGSSCGRTWQTFA